MCLLLYLASLKLALRRLAWLHTVCPLDTLPSVSKSPERRAILQQQCQQSSSTIGGSSSESSGSRSTITSPPEHTPVCPSARSSGVPQLLPSPPLSSLVLTMDSTGFATITLMMARVTTEVECLRLQQQQQQQHQHQQEQSTEIWLSGV
ncbi:hypothetical protein TYRP_019081 [Tyrophagus putrescentiae]|nr:hypothetical protein TYRP_019081 [Tyrophagus putrescentiae]